MIYSFKEYKPSFDTPIKRHQELIISTKIMDLLNKNKYYNLEDFIIKNDNYQDFLKKNNMSNVIKHFGNSLKEEDYIEILENLRTITKTKQDFEKENIKTTNIDNKQYISFKGKDKTYFIDNSRTDEVIEDQMKDLQTTQQQFQTTDIKKNTENMFKELETKKEGLNINYLHDINYESLNNEEKALFQNAYEYQQNTKDVVRIDLEKGIIVDSLNNIMRIKKTNGKYYIIKENNGDDKKEIIEEKTYQKTLTPNPNTIYSN